ncbi:uncharacterized protein LOC105837615 isoform X1 [Monomorium pharaonis]|uniref:uncharacterized protein LOC105837615 isoform X1 n=1 Tax=Monomorium pharaonis TaxID=307658 RepID=UPI0017474A2A|nr:uncharacterized protein LOC105837615 isoform X1 [Monomorium pharaonis]XP_036141565.1 uncharacterized protein LOC105837615 isoform X1 [Monomorium pharaonis]
MHYYGFGITDRIGKKNFVSEFREYYLLRRYLTQLRHEIQSRLQKSGERYRKYATGVLTMMPRSRGGGGYTVADQLDTLYENMEPRYKLYVRRDDTTRVNDLLRHAEDYEAFDEQYRARQATSKSTVAAAAYDKTECCWRCKQRGHPRLSKNSEEVLLAVWPGRRLYTRLSPPAEKCHRGRGKRGRTLPFQIIYNPRPHLPIRIRGLPFLALLDIGSEALISSHTAAQWARRPEKVAKSRFQK